MTVVMVTTDAKEDLVTRDAVVDFLIIVVDKVGQLAAAWLSSTDLTAAESVPSIFCVIAVVTRHASQDAGVRAAKVHDTVPVIDVFRPMAALRDLQASSFPTQNLPAPVLCLVGMNALDTADGAPHLARLVVVTVKVVLPTFFRADVPSVFKAGDEVNVEDQDAEHLL